MLPLERARGSPGIGVVLVAAVVPLMHAVAMAAMGFGFILDDWYTLRNAHFDGAFAAAGGDQLLARPGAWAVYGIVFGLLGHSPLVILLLLAVIRSATVVALWRLLTRFVSEPFAAVVAAVWVVLPVTSSLEFWASGSNISLSLLIAVLGCTAFDRSIGVAREPVLASLLLGASALLYEAVVPAAVVVVAALAFRCQGGDLRAVMRTALVPLVALGGASVWMLANWNPSKSPTREVADFSSAFGAHLGWGVVGFTPFASVVIAVLLGVVLWSFGTLAAPSLRSAGLGEQSVVSGVLLVIVSFVPFALYSYEPLGVGDRVNVTASVGTALVWSGAGLMLWKRCRPVVLAAGVATLLLATAMRAQLMSAYSWAAAEAERVVAAVPCAYNGEEPLIAGPRPEVRYNVTSFTDSEDHLEPAVQMTLGNPDIEVAFIRRAEDLSHSGGADLSLTDPMSCDE